MIRIMVVLLGVLAVNIGVGMFLLKHKVQALEEELVEVNREIRLTQENIHVLKAEWSFLNDPARIYRLAEQHLGMMALMPEQIMTATALRATLDATAQNQSRGQTNGGHHVLPVNSNSVSDKTKSLIASRAERKNVGQSATFTSNPNVHTTKASTRTPTINDTGSRDDNIH